MNHIDKNLCDIIDLVLLYFIDYDTLITLYQNEPPAFVMLSKSQNSCITIKTVIDKKFDGDIETVIKTITKLTQKRHYELLETLAEDVFNELFKNINILGIKLRLEKTEIIKNTSSVGIEISKKRL